MNLDFVRNQALPGLAWLCEIRCGARAARVIHGDRVETRAGFFFDGVWAGDFTSGDFLSQPAFGSGASVVDDGIVFRPPDHFLDRLFYTKDGDTLCVSNSLAFLLEATNDELDPAHIHYGTALSEISLGIKHFHSMLPTKGQNQVSIFYWNSMRVSPDLEVTWIDNPTQYNFSDFGSYKRCLLGVLELAFENARDELRTTIYEPLATLSSGYDSVAIAALATELGCRRAITFPEARSKSAFIDDSGEPIAEALGLEVQVIDRLAYCSFEDMPEVETDGVGSEMSSARDLLSNKVVLSGYMGDTMWERNTPRVSTEIPWSLIAGHNLNELRLRWGYINLPVPFIAAREHPAINRISRSEEMRPWRLFNDYDRPICRRIAEEAGVERHLFGQKKKATGVFYAQGGYARRWPRNPTLHTWTILRRT